jgi:HlyD family secretion protein
MIGCGAVACARAGQRAPQVEWVEVRPQTIEVTAAADGVVEPIRTVEVKAKSSGEIVEMRAETGDLVAEGQVLLQLLPRDAQNAYEQARAELDSARARSANARLQLERARQLHGEGMISAVELEAADLAATTARSDVVRTQKALDNAAERLAETTVRSPIAGTVIGRSVEVGQVIGSAVSQVGGGSLLFTLADLDEVQVRSLVDEVDIGRLRAGLPVTIQVEAYPERAFEGEILKIEPQAVVEQNVTMFPVLTRIDNREGLLKPGMNAEVEVGIARREGVLAVPNEAVKTPEEARQLAALLGLEVEPAAGPRRAAGAGGESASARRGRDRAGRGSPAAGPAGTDGGESPAGAAGGASRGGQPGTVGGARGGGSRVVFVKRGERTEAVVVETGLRNWEMTEIVSGLAAGDRVALLPSAAQLRQSAEFRERFQRSRGLPGMGGGQQRPRGGGSP